MKKKLFWALSLGFILTSCSQTPTKEKYYSGYSSETQSTFENIENNEDLQRQKALETYRQWRELDRQNMIETPESYTRKHRYYRPPSAPQAPRRTTKKKTAPVRNKVTMDAMELKKEIDQNLSYYCMAKRKEYQNRYDCDHYAQNVYHECREKFDENERGLLSCVKSRLKR